MRNFILGFALCLATLITAVVIAGTVEYPETRALNMRRACIPSSAAVTVDCSAAASASSAELTQDSRVEIMCTDDSYLDFGSSAPTAASGDMILPSLAWYEFTTSSAVRYVACRNVNSDMACYYHICE
jgi:hypothetical protein